MPGERQAIVSPTYPVLVRCLPHPPTWCSRLHLRNPPLLYQHVRAPEVASPRGRFVVLQRVFSRVWLGREGHVQNTEQAGVVSARFAVTDIEDRSLAADGSARGSLRLVLPPRRLSPMGTPKSKQLAEIQ